MKRREAECILSALAGYETAMSALAAMVSLTDAAKHMGYRSVRHALDSLKEHNARQLRDAAAERRPPGANGAWRPLAHAAPGNAARAQAPHS